MSVSGLLIVQVCGSCVSDVWFRSAAKFQFCFTVVLQLPMSGIQHNLEILTFIVTGGLKWARIFSFHSTRHFCEITAMRAWLFIVVNMRPHWHTSMARPAHLHSFAVVFACLDSQGVKGGKTHRYVGCRRVTKSQAPPCLLYSLRPSFQLRFCSRSIHYIFCSCSSIRGIRYALRNLLILLVSLRLMANRW